MMRCGFHNGLAVLAAAVFFCACGGNHESDEGAPVRVAAAANLQRVLPAIAGEFERASGATVELSFASSGRIAAQVEAGAPIDLVLSADSARIEALVAKKRVRKETAQVYAKGRLALALSPHLEFLRGNIAGLSDSRARTIGLANPGLAPYGAAAEQALRRAGVWSALEDRLIIGENVGHVYQYWKSGNVVAAFVPLALLDESDPHVVVPKHLYDELNQMLGIPDRAKNLAGAAKFVDFLMSKRGQDAFQAGGFAPAAPQAGKRRR